MSSPNFQCAMCARFDKKNKKANTCEPYPDGIPIAIITNEHNHHQPYRGDKGLTFKPIPKEV